MRLSKQLFVEKLKKPEEYSSSLETGELIKKVGFIEFIDAGFLFYNPIGKRILDNINHLLISMCEERELAQIQTPLMHNIGLVKKSNKYEEFNSEFFESKGKVMLATSEEYILELARRGLNSYTQLPIRFFELTEAFRDIKRPQGILKTRQFGGVVLTSLDVDEKINRESKDIFNELIRDFFQNLNIPYIALSKKNGEEYIYHYEKGDVFNKIGNKTVNGLSLAMGYKFDRTERFEVSFQYKDNLMRDIYINSYGIGTQRCFFACLDSNRDDLGFNLPEKIKPYKKAVILLDPKNTTQRDTAERLYSSLKQNDSVYLDDRNKITLKDKLEFADLIGVNEKYLVGNRECEKKKITIKDRGGRENKKSLCDLLI